MTMLQSKDTKTLSELTTAFCATYQKETFFSEFVAILKLGKLHGYFNSAKSKGVSGLLVLKTMLSFSFLGHTTVNSFTTGFWKSYASAAKDVYYRLKHNSKINWRGLLYSVLKRALLTLEQDTEQQQGIQALIFDDTTIAKTGSKIEGVSKVWDHVLKRSILGYKLLVMGYYNGSTFLAADFSLHREKGSNKKMFYGLKAKVFRKQFKKKRAKDLPAATRKKEIDSSKIASAVAMIKRGIKKGITAQYVLTDSWFTCWEMIKTTLDNQLHYIGMFCKSKTNFEYQKKSLTYKQIRTVNRKKCKRNKKYKLYYIRVVVTYNQVPVVLYFTRKGKKGNWKTIISTDLTANFTKTIEIYQIRWSIEVFFKESKQLLGLGKEQSTDFDSQIAATTIVMLQHLLLTIRHQIDDYHSIGGVFEATKETTLKLKLHQRLLSLLIAIAAVIEEFFAEIDIDILTKTLINNQQALQKIKYLIDKPYDELIDKVA